MHVIGTMKKVRQSAMEPFIWVLKEVNRWASWEKTKRCIWDTAAGPCSSNTKNGRDYKEHVKCEKMAKETGTETHCVGDSQRKNYNDK